MRLLLGHRIDPAHVTYFPDALKIADRVGVRSDPAYVMLDPDGKVRWKHVGMIDPAELLKALCPGRVKENTGRASAPCAANEKR